MKVLGINGFGRIGKLTVWHQIARKHFDEIVVNLGRQVGADMEDIAHYLERDSTYGLIQGYLYGQAAGPLISDINQAQGTLTVDGMTVRFLRSERNPAQIGWADHGVRLVVDTTGQFSRSGPGSRSSQRCASGAPGSRGGEGHRLGPFQDRRQGAGDARRCRHHG